VSDERICSDEIVYIRWQRVEKVRMELGDERGKMKVGDVGEGAVSKAFSQAAAASRLPLISQNKWNVKLANMWHCHRLSMQTCLCRPSNKSSSQIAAF